MELQPAKVAVAQREEPHPSATAEETSNVGLPKAKVLQGEAGEPSEHGLLLNGGAPPPPVAVISVSVHMSNSRHSMLLSSATVLDMVCRRYDSYDRGARFRSLRRC